MKQSHIYIYINPSFTDAINKVYLKLHIVSLEIILQTSQDITQQV